MRIFRTRHCLHFTQGVLSLLHSFQNVNHLSDRGFNDYQSKFQLEELILTKQTAMWRLGTNLDEDFVIRMFKILATYTHPDKFLEVEGMSISSYSIFILAFNFFQILFVLYIYRKRQIGNNKKTYNSNRSNGFVQLLTFFMSNILALPLIKINFGLLSSCS